MKSMWFAFVAIAIIAVGADIGLDYAGLSTAEITTSSSVRLD